MIRKDYILRLIEQFGALWARVVTQLRAGLLHDTRATLDDAYARLFGLNAEIVRMRSSGELLARLQFGEPPEVGRERCFVLSALLGAEADLAAAQNNPDLAATYRTRALDIVLAMRLGSPEQPLPDYAPTVDMLVEALRDYQLPFDTGRLLFQLYEQQGAFALAENILFELLDLDHDPEAVARIGESFYDRLQQHNDAELQAGDFSRAEIDSGRRQLRQRLRRA
jgi:hypothetical protein